MIEPIEDQRKEPTGLAGGTSASTFTPGIRFVSGGVSVCLRTEGSDERADR
jgi:hypothetical protein